MQQSVPVQQRLFDGIDPTYTTVDFFKTITANMIMTAEPQQIESPYHEVMTIKRIAVIQTALLELEQQWYSNLKSRIKAELASFLPRFLEGIS